MSFKISLESHLVLIKVRLIIRVAGLVVVSGDNSKDVKDNQQYPSLELIERDKFHPSL